MDTKITPLQIADPFHCPNCHKGVLERSSTALRSERLSWFCNNTPECLYSTEDLVGEPMGQFTCARCGGQLRLILTLDEPYFACSNYYAAKTCKTSYPLSEDREPDFSRGEYED